MFLFLLAFLPSLCKAKITQQSSHKGETGRLMNGANVLEPGIFVCFPFLLHFSYSLDKKSLTGLK